MNTGLFTLVKMNIKDWDDSKKAITVHIQVAENWYIYPFPIFELADRNFNVWWVEQERDFRRLNLGVRLYYVNLTGRKDLLKTIIQVGYAQKLEVRYTLPFFNQAQTLGFTTNIMLNRSKEITYKTEGNKQIFFRDDERFLLKRFRAGMGLSYRPKQRGIFRVGLNFYSNKVPADFIQEYNPNFFLDGKSLQQYISIAANYSYDFRNIKAYPTKGFFAKAGVQKDGIGIFSDRNSLKANIYLAKYFSLSKRLSLEFKFKAGTELIRKQQDYYNYRALGYGDDYVRAYEYYVIDGQDYVYTKSSMRFEFFSKSFDWGKAMPIKAFKKMPYKFYLTLNTDVAYVNDNYYTAGNELNNRPLYGGGLGIDLVIYYDKIIQFEYSMNHLQEKALFLHYNISF